MADQKQMFRDDGSYDFKKREDWDYKHTYDYMAGWLGQASSDAERKRKKKLGKTDIQAPPLPKDISLVESIERTARYVHKSSDPQVFERLVQEKNKGQQAWAFLQEGGEGSDYYKFFRHCLEREVDARPLAEQARKVKEDRDLKQANAKNNVFAAGLGETKAPLKEPVFKVGELMEVIGVKSKPDYNGKIVRVTGYHAEVDRYEVKFEGGRYNTVVVKLREENLMYSSVAEHDADAAKELPEGELPNGTVVEIRGLQSEPARWMNGQKAIIVQWDKDGERYEVRMELNNTIKSVKPANLRIPLPEGWEEHYDEHLGRSYFMNAKTQKVTWKHPTVANQRAKFGQVRENNAEDLEGVEIDADRKHYDVDDEEEMEGGFNLMELVKKVEEQEERREAAEEAGEDVDSDDGMHRVKKKRKKKKQKEITVESLQAKLTKLQEQTMVGRVTMRKDYKLLDGHFVAKDMDPVLEQWEANPDDPPPEVLKAAFEVMIGLLEKGVVLMSQVRKSKLQMQEISKLIDRITTLTTPAQLLQDAKWVAGMLKTM